MNHTTYHSMCRQKRDLKKNQHSIWKMLLLLNITLDFAESPSTAVLVWDEEDYLLFTYLVKYVFSFMLDLKRPLSFISFEDLAFPTTGPINPAWSCEFYNPEKKRLICKIDHISEKRHPNGFNCTPAIATLTCQSGSHLTLFAPFCAFLLILRWLHQTHGLWKSCALLRKQLSGHRC